jgi:beta-lysine 5,6-aminomutase alpha subunit
MQNKLKLSSKDIESCHDYAKSVVQDVNDVIDSKSSVSIERTILRVLGVDGVNEFDAPLPNILIDHIVENGGIEKGVSYWLGNAIIQTGLTVQEIAQEVNDGNLKITNLPIADFESIKKLMFNEYEKSLENITSIRKKKEQLRDQLGENPPPHTYVLTATGNVYEDVTHALADANYGADIIAVIRSTAQSLLDYVPFGATTEGYGGTYATQENFRIMREALNDWGKENGRYVRLSSFCSGLCMPEIAVLGALEGLDNMANDALYGILYRDINMIRTLIDQKMSRMINGFAGIVINTGEDNYLRTADAIKAAPSVVASQMINYHFALDAGLVDDQIGIGNAYEIDPKVTNGFLLELAQAQLTRELFPKCRVKYMPPTKHMNGNIFRTHAMDTLFNLITITTDQQIQTIGVPTEGFYTPVIQDRTLSLENVKFVFNNAKNLADEIVFKQDGIIQSRAKEVLKEAEIILKEVKNIGLFNAIKKGYFGDVCRSVDGGRGLDGVFTKSSEYINPLYELIKGK